ncbi:MAG: hypothetical protein AVDCRST_MAG10-830, partial [uncultured Acidimicrobiales bacterium]
DLYSSPHRMVGRRLHRCRRHTRLRHGPGREPAGVDHRGNHVQLRRRPPPRRPQRRRERSAQPQPHRHHHRPPGGDPRAVKAEVPRADGRRPARARRRLPARLQLVLRRRAGDRGPGGRGRGRQRRRGERAGRGPRRRPSPAVLRRQRHRGRRRSLARPRLLRRLRQRRGGPGRHGEGPVQRRQRPGALGDRAGHDRRPLQWWWRHGGATRRPHRLPGGRHVQRRIRPHPGAHRPHVGPSHHRPLQRRQCHRSLPVPHV